MVRVPPEKCTLLVKKAVDSLHDGTWRDDFVRKASGESLDEHSQGCSVAGIRANESAPRQVRHVDPSKLVKALVHDVGMGGSSDC